MNECQTRPGRSKAQRAHISHCRLRGWEQVGYCFDLRNFPEGADIRWVLSPPVCLWFAVDMFYFWCLFLFSIGIPFTCSSLFCDYRLLVDSREIACVYYESIIIVMAP